MEREFYIHIDQFGEEHIIEERTPDEIIKEFRKVEHGNDMRVLWDLIGLMKTNYEQGNDEAAVVYFDAAISIIKQKLAAE
jgi:hypothetical protein